MGTETSILNGFFEKRKQGLGKTCSGKEKTGKLYFYEVKTRNCDKIQVGLRFPQTGG